jgi:hypothetical protein
MAHFHPEQTSSTGIKRQILSTNRSTDPSSAKMNSAYCGSASSASAST